MTLSLAQGADLVREWTTFSDLPKGDSLLTGATCNEDGSLSVKLNPGTHKDRPTAYLTGRELSLTKGVTISFNIKDFEYHSNANLISLASENSEFLFSIAAAMSGYPLFCFNSSYHNAQSMGELRLITPNTDYAYFTLTSKHEGGKCIFTLYRNGEQVGEARAFDSRDLASQPLTRITLGGWSGNSNSAMTTLDINQLAIYDGTMTDDEVKKLYNDFLEGPKTNLTPLTLACISAALILLAGVAFIFRRR